MIARLRELRERRDALVAQAARERDDIARAWAALDRRVATARSLAGQAAGLARRFAWVLLPLAAATLLRRARRGRLLSTALLALQVSRTALPLISMLIGRRSRDDRRARSGSPADGAQKASRTQPRG